MSLCSLEIIFQSFGSPIVQTPLSDVVNPMTVAMTSDDLDAWLGSDDHSPKSVATVSFYI